MERAVIILLTAVPPIATVFLTSLSVRKEPSMSMCTVLLLYIWVQLEETMWPLLIPLVTRQTPSCYVSISFLLCVSLCATIHLHAVVKLIIVYSFDILPILYVLQSGYQLVIDSFVVLKTHFVGVITPGPIDLIIVNISASDFGQYSPPQTYLGRKESMPVAINLGYCLGCSPNYTLCTVDTVPQCVLEHECINGKSWQCMESSCWLPLLQTKKPWLYLGKRILTEVHIIKF